MKKVQLFIDDRKQIEKYVTHKLKQKKFEEHQENANKKKEVLATFTIYILM